MSGLRPFCFSGQYHATKIKGLCPYLLSGQYHATKIRGLRPWHVPTKSKQKEVVEMVEQDRRLSYKLDLLSI